MGVGAVVSPAGPEHRAPMAGAPGQTLGDLRVLSALPTAASEEDGSHTVGMPPVCARQGAHAAPQNHPTRTMFGQKSGDLARRL